MKFNNLLKIAICIPPIFSCTTTIAQEIANPRLGKILFTRANNFSYNYPEYKRTKTSWDIVNGKYILAAKYGNAAAMYALGGNYNRLGDSDKSTEWYLKAAQGGLFNGYYYAATNLLEKATPECDSAIAHLKNASAKGNYSSDILIIEIHANGYCQTLSPQQQFETLLNSKHKDIANRPYYLAKYYFEGNGTKKNIFRAYAYAKIATTKFYYNTKWSKVSSKIANEQLEMIEKEAFLTPETTTKSYDSLVELCTKELNCNFLQKNKLPAEVYERIFGSKTAYMVAPAPPSPPPMVQNYNDLSGLTPSEYSALSKLYFAARSMESEKRQKVIFKLDYAQLRANYDTPELQKFPLAKLAIARLYREEGNEDKATENHLIAAKMGNRVGAYEVGIAYMKSPEKCNEGFEYLKSARAKYLWQSAIELAKIYEQGICGKSDINAAIKEYEHSASYGHSPSQIALSNLYWNGQKLPKDALKSYIWGVIGYYNNPQIGVFAAREIRETHQRTLTQSASFTAEELNKAKDEISDKCLVAATCNAISDYNIIEILK